MYCVVKNCKSIWQPTCNIVFHSFPKDARRRDLWLSVIPLKGKFYLSAKICSLHFKRDDYDPERPRILLNSAVPFYFPLPSGSIVMTEGSVMASSGSSFVKCEPESPLSCDTPVKTEPDSQEVQQLKLAAEVKPELNPEYDVPIQGNIVKCTVKKEPSDEEQIGQEPYHTQNTVEVKCEFDPDPEDNLPLPSDYLEQHLVEEPKLELKEHEDCPPAADQTTIDPVRIKIEPADDQGGAEKETDKSKQAKDITNKKKQRKPTKKHLTRKSTQTGGDQNRDTGQEKRTKTKDKSSTETNEPPAGGEGTHKCGAGTEPETKRKAERNPGGKKPRKRSGPTQVGERPHECDTCHKRFTELCHLIAHYSAHTEDKLHICNICQRQFTRRSNLKTHLRLHTGESLYKCTMCQSRFTSKSKLELHIKRHTGEKPYECDLCKSRFADKCTLKRHMRTHTGEKPFQCSVCDIRFTERTSLQAHLTTHTGEKPFKCSVCRKRFSRKGNLQTHFRRHTGEKPFECSVCNNRFTEKSTLIRHSRTHTGEKPYECSVCLSRFTLKTKLKRHLKKHSLD